MRARTRQAPETVKMEVLAAAQLAAPSEIHDVPTARMPAATLEQEIARSLPPRARLARGSSQFDALADPAEVVVVRTFAGRHPWLVAAFAIAAAVLIVLALHGAAGP